MTDLGRDSDSSFLTLTSTVKSQGEHREWDWEERTEGAGRRVKVGEPISGLR